MGTRCIIWRRFDAKEDSDFYRLVRLCGGSGYLVFEQLCVGSMVKGMAEIKYRLDFSLFGFKSILGQLKEQGYTIENEKAVNEINQYEDLITSINFSQLMDIVTQSEREKIFKRVAKRIAKIVNENT